MPEFLRLAAMQHLILYKKDGLNFGALNRLNGHGLIISDYNSWHDYKLSIGISPKTGSNYCAYLSTFKGDNGLWFQKTSVTRRGILGCQVLL